MLANVDWSVWPFRPGQPVVGTGMVFDVVTEADTAGAGIVAGVVTETDAAVVIGGFLTADAFASSIVVEQLWCSIVLPTRPPITAAMMAIAKAESTKTIQFGKRLRT